MLEVKDPAIKLFGKTIQLLSDEGLTDSATINNIPAVHHQQNYSTTTYSTNNEKPSGGILTETKQEDVSSHLGGATSSGISEDPKTRSSDKETPSLITNKEDQSETSISEENTLKKPDKILPCPRCNSMDTKFCYYNNYNVNQPRHFCKKCQRYWTAGGTMRNVPVGSGRRKNKSSLASPLCESMASALILAEKSKNYIHNGFCGHEQRNGVSCGGREYGDDHSSVSSCTASNSKTSSPWPNPWKTQLRYPMQPPALGPLGFPVSFYPQPHYWGCTIPSHWNIPWISPQPSSFENSALSSCPNSPTLGKHSRDGNMIKPSISGKEELSEERELERGVLISKTLRINDPSEAAKSSIWSTLGIKNDNADSISGGSLFKAFQPKGSEKNHTAEMSPVLQANPAALSRSLNFCEST